MRLAPVACALLLVLAGCGAVTDQASPTPTLTPTADEEPETPSPTPEIDTNVISAYGSELPFDPTPIFLRVLNMTDERVDAPVVEVEEPGGSSPDIFDRSTSSFRSALGIVPPERTNDSGVQLGAYTPSSGNSVHIYEGAFENETYARSTLAHEFVHVVQFREGWGSTVWSRQSGTASSLTHDGRLTYYLVLEGAASYVEQQYKQRFLPTAPVLESYGQAAYENASAHSRLNIARYVLGAQYVDDTVDSPADIERVHTEPPVSSEQVLHRNDDPVADLSVDANDVSSWEAEHERDRQGELFLRVALRTELNRSAAAAAAHGWGNDVRLTYEREDATGTAWVLRWDDARNATEFEDSFERYLGAKATRQGGVWKQGDGNATYRLQRVSEQNVVVYLGNESFVRAANATVEADSRVEVGARNESAA